MPGIESASLIDPWIFSTLNGDGEIIGLVGAGNVYGALVLDPPAGPYVTYSMLSSRDIRGVSIHRIQVDAIYLVKVVSQSESKDDALPIAERCDELLNVGGVSLPAGHLICTRETTVDAFEVLEGQPFHHLGGTYRIRANLNT